MHETEKQRREKFINLMIDYLETLCQYYLAKAKDIRKTGATSPGLAFLEETKNLSNEYRLLADYLTGQRLDYMTSVQPDNFLADLIRNAPIQDYRNGTGQKKDNPEIYNHLIKLAQKYDHLVIEEEIKNLKSQTI